MEKKDVLKLLIERAGPGHYRHFVDSNGKTKYAYEKGEITDAMIDAHLAASQPLGIHCVHEKRKSRFLIFDIDDHGDDGDAGLVSRVASAIAGALEHNDVPWFAVRSGGGVGIHIWVVCEDEYSTDQLLQNGKQILKVATAITSKVWPEEELAAGVGGIFCGEDRETHKIEIFPKSEKGSCIALPFSRKSRALKVSNGPDEHGFVNLADADNVEVVLAKKQKPGRKSSAEKAVSIDYDAAFDAFIQNYNVDDRNSYVGAALCLHAAFGRENDWARERWVAWAKTSSAYKDGDEEEWFTKTVARNSAITFWLHAKDRGYNGDLPYTKAERKKLSALSFFDDVRLLRDRTGEAIAQIGEREFVSVASSDFKQHALLGIMREQGELLDENTLRQVSVYAAACARETEKEDVWVRFGEKHGKRYLHLADDSNTIIEIDEVGWRVSEDTDIVFRRGDSLELPQPDRGKLEDFCDFLNVGPEDIPFILAWMVTAFYSPSQQCPILMLDGQAGSGKSSALKTVLGTIDPKVGMMAGLPENEADLIAAAYSAGTVSFDNLESIAKMSQHLCRLATGGGMRKRKLYTDNETVSYDAMKPIMLVGIEPTYYKQDLSERIMRVTLKKPKEYLDDEQFGLAIEQRKAGWLGSVLDLLSLCVREVPKITEKKSRFATYVRIGEVIARSMGYDEGWFSNAVRAKQENEIGDVALSDYVLMYIAWTIASGPDEGSVSCNSKAWLDKMVDEVRSGTFDAPWRDVPENAKQMGARIMAAAPHLEKRGIRVTRGRRREYVFTWRRVDQDAVQRFMEEVGDQLPF